ncbi:hypothetical protein Aconfl_01020 [Algoriphagus confluentis]|uniref:Uncharacterized protein n=1 Tax=Algoriphagus confluentis TaxID=1697556 RepID=A0ABQ6PJL1_9BACT|nr:hypothetical protein Aconfl_01020 [Algoriphagus confluentis]
MNSPQKEFIPIKNLKIKIPTYFSPRASALLPARMSYRIRMIEVGVASMVPVDLRELA